MLHAQSMQTMTALKEEVSILYKSDIELNAALWVLYIIRELKCYFRNL